jgi:GTPase SAR1 family protein
MGNCNRSGSIEKDKNALIIDEIIRKEKRDFKKQINLLLLGAGDSGKSTIFKQIRIIHLSGFNEEERKSYKLAVIGNMINTLQCLIRASASLGIKLEEDNQKAAENVLRLSGLSDLTEDIRNDIIKISKDKSLMKTMRQSNINVPDATPHFLKHVTRIMDDKLIPTTEDILYTRIKTMGISDISFEIEGNNFKLIDVGGQRSERRKWIHYFSEVTAVIFCVALSEYNMWLEEDPTVNRMLESLQLFKEICNSEWFKEVALILFLNKSDLFQEKITKVNIDVCFPDYKGSSEFTEASEFIEKKFLHVDKTGRKKIYPHRTIATDTANIQFVFQAVRDRIIQMAITDYDIHHSL